MRLVIFVVSIILLALLWTNPDNSDFKKWVIKKELTNSQTFNSMPVRFRSKNYLFFSLHELSIIRKQHADLIVEQEYYSGIGIMGMIFPISIPGIDDKQSPIIK
ncbi:hypothetical protein [Paenibacillus qinlingensis]|uniref:hypothetical protein n=1 Tax=Paenibacillus qinlingensis TaxID=1837343 RepID=UPI0015648B4C|nr:hypothetical protein [Paenibacillus qinlingensis]NQX63079.1 hypothetical protein [Paenibacillus qinlingensis]